MQMFEDQQVYDIFGQLIAEHVTVFDAKKGENDWWYGNAAIEGEDEMPVYSYIPGIWRPL